MVVDFGEVDRWGISVQAALMKVVIFVWLILMGVSLGKNRMTEEQAEKFVELALAGLAKEYPNKISVMLRSEEDLKTPQEMFPVFYGHFDWHSSVHGHWTLVRLLRLYPEAEWGEKVRGALRGKFSKEKFEKEAEYLRKNRSFERMYGWAWALRLGIELRSLEDEEGKRWAKWFVPVEEVIVEHAKGYLPKLSWPIRVGTHTESAFALGQMIDWARVSGDEGLEKLVKGKAVEFYGKDRDYPVRYEPSGSDFFSAGLNEADLMRRVWEGEKYGDWLEGFFPGLKEGELGNLLVPAEVTDFEDGHLVHLAGLNLTRGWTMRGIAVRVEEPRRGILLKAADAHEALGLKQIFSGSYAGEHWLGSFATYLLTGVGEG